MSLVDFCVVCYMWESEINWPFHLTRPWSQGCILPCNWDKITGTSFRLIGMFCKHNNGHWSIKRRKLGSHCQLDSGPLFWLATISLHLWSFTVLQEVLFQGHSWNLDPQLEAWSSRENDPHLVHNLHKIKDLMFSYWYMTTIYDLLCHRKVHM